MGIGPRDHFQGILNRSKKAKDDPTMLPEDANAIELAKKYLSKPKGSYEHEKPGYKDYEEAPAEIEAESEETGPSLDLPQADSDDPLEAGGTSTYTAGGGAMKKRQGQESRGQMNLTRGRQSTLLTG